LHIKTLSDFQSDNSQDVEPNLEAAELCIRPKEEPITLTDVPPVAGLLKIPATWTEMTGMSKLVKQDTIADCCTTVALAVTRKPFPEADLHKRVESAFQMETPQLDPWTSAFALLENLPKSRPNIVTDAEPVTMRFDGLTVPTIGLEKDKKTCTVENWLPELIRSSINVAMPAHDRAEIDESEVQRDCTDVVVP
jgi:hypothetical protein